MDIKNRIKRLEGIIAPGGIPKEERLQTIIVHRPQEESWPLVDKEVARIERHMRERYGTTIGLKVINVLKLGKTGMGETRVETIGSNGG